MHMGATCILKRNISQMFFAVTKTIVQSQKSECGGDWNLPVRTVIHFRISCPVFFFFFECKWDFRFSWHWLFLFTIFWDVNYGGFVPTFRRSMLPPSFRVHYRFFQNVGTFLPDCAASHPKISQYPRRKVKNMQNWHFHFCFVYKIGVVWEFGNTAQKKIFRPKRAEVTEGYKNFTVRSVVICYRGWWDGQGMKHVLQHWEMHKYLYLENQKRRSRHRWDDDIKMNIKNGVCRKYELSLSSPRIGAVLGWCDTINESSVSVKCDRFLE